VTYDGSPDSRSFHQFLTEVTAYVKDGQVEPRKRVFILAHYLKGRAREFYTREVSGDPYRWRLKGFFTELFNYCFPINFRMKQREKLNRCYQNDKSVREYIYELSELWNMIGDVGERQKVTRLWTGLNASIQTELWKKELNPESSSFRDVKNAVEVIEIAHSVPASGRERRSKDKLSRNEPTTGEIQKIQKGGTPLDEVTDMTESVGMTDTGRRTVRLRPKAPLGALGLRGTSGQKGAGPALLCLCTIMPMAVAGNRHRMVSLKSKVSADAGGASRVSKFDVLGQPSPMIISCTYKVGHVSISNESRA